MEITYDWKKTGIHQLLVSSDDVNMLDENTSTIKKPKNLCQR
jgi:hypothetical protein